MSGEIQKQFLLTSKIGNGNFSTVYLAKHIQTQQIVAIKTMKNHIPIAIKQAQILKKMNHPNVIKLYKFQKPKNKQQALIVLEYVPQNILQLYEAQQYGLKQEQVKCILFQSCLGLHHIHKKGIIHRDIKPQNIMINRNKAEVKLIDFGLAIEQDKCITDYVATRWYRAPQNLLGTKQYTVAIDIFSLGCVIVELYLGNPLFPGANNIDQISKILTIIGEPSIQSWRKGYQMFVKLGLNFQVKSQRKRITLKSLLSSCSQGLTRIIQKMLVLNPSKRISAEQILKDPYFKQIDKIIPPHVYDQYLIDIKSSRLSMIKDVPKSQKRNQTKERVRFLSQQKSFGAFSSFKTTVPICKFQQQFSKQKDKISIEKIEPIKKISLEKILKDCGACENQNSQSSVFRKSKVSSFIKNQGIKDSGINEASQKIGITDVSSNIKNSIDKYEKNILKLSTSLKSIKLLKNNSDLKNQKSQESLNIYLEENNQENKYRKSNEMLSFRGFNQPKQKMSMKDSGSTFLKKNPPTQQKFDKFPIKNKKVMEYLQKFQNIANQTQLHKQKLENSRSEPIIYQSLNNTPKRPQILISNGTKSPLLQRQIQQNNQNQVNLSQANYPQQSKQKDSFYQNQYPSTTNLSQSFQKDFSPINQTQQIRSSDMIYLPSQNNFNQNYEFQSRNISNNQSLNSGRSLIQSSPMVKFSTKNTSRQSCQIQNQSISNQNSIHSSRIITEDQRNFHIINGKSRQAFYAQPQSINSSTYLNESKNLITSSMNISSNRPIQNKIKLIAVRDNVPDNGQSRNMQSSLAGSVSNMNFIRNPSYYQSSPNNNFVDNKQRFIHNNSNNFQKNNQIASYTTLNSPRRQSQQIQTGIQNQIYPVQYHNRNTINDLNQQKAKQFKSLQHRQFFTKKSPANRYSINTNEQVVSMSYINNYTPVSIPVSVSTEINNRNEISNRNDLNSRNQIKGNQKNHQTTLSQLRESITGLTQTLNEGAFLSQRSQKYNNKNININLNLNIYQKRSPKKQR